MEPKKATTKNTKKDPGTPRICLDAVTIIRGARHTPPDLGASSDPFFFRIFRVFRGCLFSAVFLFVMP